MTWTLQQHRQHSDKSWWHRLWNQTAWVQNPLGRDINGSSRTSLVVQWMRIHLPMQGTWVQSLVQKIPHAAEQLSLSTTTTEPSLWGPWATTTELLCGNYWNLCTLGPVLHKRSHHSEKPVHRNKEQSLLTATRESPRKATKTQHSQQ